MRELRGRVLAGSGEEMTPEWEEAVLDLDQLTIVAIDASRIQSVELKDIRLPDGVYVVPDDKGEDDGAANCRGSAQE